MKLKITDLEEAQLKNYILVLQGIKTCTAETMDEIAGKYLKAGEGEGKEQLRRVLVEQYLKTVVSIAANYRGAGMTFARLIRSGNSALVEAVISFKEEEINGFSQYISWSIESNILDELAGRKKNSEQSEQKERLKNGKKRHFPEPGRYKGNIRFRYERGGRRN
jgi:DNA-directed RNA polymerase sigma subunit (sigma70/sigma32)